MQDIYSLGNNELHEFQFARLSGFETYAKTFHAEAVRFSAKRRAKYQKSIYDQVDCSISLRQSLYRPLTGAWDIRLLELHPGAFDDHLIGTLLHCSIEFEYGNLDKKNSNLSVPTKHALHSADFTKPIWYTALSYTWGSSILKGKRSCGVHCLSITKPLETALRYFRQPNHSVVIWIDQICISQDDEAEKARQIPLMGRIYRHAFNTVGWLGEADEESDQAFDLLRTIRTNLSLVERTLTPEDFDTFSMPGLSSECWQALWRLLDRPYFRRLWVIQENVLSDDFWAFCGTRLFNADEFKTACGVLQRSGLDKLVWRNGHTNSRTSGGAEVLEQLRYGIAEVFRVRRGHYQLFEAMTTTRYSRASVPHDKVYGLLGICGQDCVKIDYSQGVAHLYRNVTREYMMRVINNFQRTKSKHNNQADALNRHSIFRPLVSVDHDSDLLGLPSWVPDWRQPRRTIPLGYLHCTASIYAAASQLNPEIAFDSINPSILIIKGKIFDQLVELSHRCTNSQISFENPALINTELREWIGIARGCYLYPTRGTLFSAFWQTLVAGKDADGTQPCPDSFEELFSLILDGTTGMQPTFPDQTYSQRQMKPKRRGKLELRNLRVRGPAKTFQELPTAVSAAMRNRRFGRTGKGYIGLFPEHSRAGDLVCVLLGSHVPFVVRRKSHKCFRLIGECYVHGIMNGEALHMTELECLAMAFV